MELLDHPLIAQRYFFPRPEPPRAPFVIEVDGARLACVYSRVDPRAPTVVHFHGNGEVVADWEAGFPEFFAALGWNLLLAEYRGYGGSGGRPLLGRLLDDVPVVLQAAGQPPERLVLFGRSVGALFAVHGAAIWPQVGGLILESGVADVLERLLVRIDPAELGCSRQELTAAVAARLDQHAKLSRYPGPALVLHAAGDSLVGVDHGRRLHAWAAGEKRLKIFSRGDHNDILAVNQREYLREISLFLEKVRASIQSREVSR